MSLTPAQADAILADPAALATLAQAAETRIVHDDASHARALLSDAAAQLADALDRAADAR